MINKLRHAMPNYVTVKEMAESLGITRNCLKLRITRRGLLKPIAYFNGRTKHWAIKHAAKIFEEMCNE